MEWKFFSYGMEMEWKKIASMEYEKIVFRSIPCPAFGTSVGDLPSPDTLLQEEFIDLVNDGNARSLFSEKSCSDF